MSEIKLFVSCHKDFYVPEHPFLIPVQAGAALSEEKFPGMRQDDGGENISAQNRSYCELTVQYWAWKNQEADYYGFFHYRRYLSFSAKAAQAEACCGRTVRPYQICRKPSAKVLEQNGYDPGHIRRFLMDYDMIAPVPENMYVPVRSHYQNAPHHHIRDLELITEIVKSRSPALYPSLTDYLDGETHIFGNIFIMRRELFEAYCAWLFPILAEYDRRKDISGYSQQALRADGYLAERLLGGYLAWIKEQGARVAFLPRIHFECMDGKGRYWEKKLETSLLPPGTKRRSNVKRLLKRA